MPTIQHTYSQLGARVASWTALQRRPDSNTQTLLNLLLDAIRERDKQITRLLIAEQSHLTVARAAAKVMQDQLQEIAALKGDAADANRRHRQTLARAQQAKEANP